MTQNLVQQYERLNIREGVRELTTQGYTVPAIAAAVGISERTVQRYRSALGISIPASGIPLTPDQLHRAEQLLTEECPLAEIADTIGCHVSTLCKKFAGRSPHRSDPLRKYRQLRKDLGLLP